MLRQPGKGNESDRFITARSVEREKRIEKFKVIEDLANDLNNEKVGLSLKESLSVEKKTRTPTIIADEKIYSKKLYLSLLKSQIFNSDGKTSQCQENKSQSQLSKRKTKYSEYISKISGDKNERRSNKNLHDSQNLEEIVKKIDFGNYSQLNTNLRTVNKFNIENLPFTDENNKSSFKKLINFEIEDSEYTKNFLRQKKIPKSPYKVLDAPNLKDDFYLHLLNWSVKDLLAVGLDKNLYIWEGKSSNVSLLHTLEDEYLSSVCWTNDGSRLLVGTSEGKINIWDVEMAKCVQTFHSHLERVGVITTMNTNGNIFTSGSQDKKMINYDIRLSPQEAAVNTFQGHTQEVCGLKWSMDDRLLASGGNDNKLILWNGNKMTLENKFKSHTSAVKALDWSPHKFGMLISGGGTQDRTLKIWNTNTMKLVESIDTSSQVCNIAFSKNSHEFVTTHGYSDNLILVWDSDTMDVKATLKGHKDRVIYLSTGPDMQKIVTGAGDETIRFWDVFVPDRKDSVLKDLDENYNKNKIEIKNFNLR